MLSSLYEEDALMLILDVKCIEQGDQSSTCRLYNGHVLVMSNHARPVVHDSEDTREISRITRKRMLEKMKSPQCVENKVRIGPPDYSKENLLVIKDLKAQLEGNLKVATGMYAIDVKPIPHPLKNNRSAHLNYINHLKESVETGDCKLSDNSFNKTKQVWKEMGKLFANVGYQWRPTRKKFTSGKLNCGYQWRPTGKKFALGELSPLTRLPVTCGTDHPTVSGLRLFKTRFRGRNGSCTHHSSLGLQCQKTFDQISSNLVSRMSQRRILDLVQAPFGKGNLPLGSKEFAKESYLPHFQVGSNSEQSHVPLAVTPRQGGNARRNVMDIIITQ
ncbi:hypothetical protein Tco_0562255 [Tanacetum coccineum]